MKIYISLLLVIYAAVSFAQPLEEFRAVKLTNVDSDVLFSDAKIARGMDYLADIGVNVVLPVVWNGSGADGVYTLYPSAVMDSLFGVTMHPAFSAERDILQRVVIEAHRNGMEVMPWFELGFSSSYSQNGGYIIKTFPHWALKDVNGKLVVKNGFDWLSAINPEVQKFILALTTEVIDNYDIDGIEYSDRIPAMPVEGGYDSVTVAIYQAEHAGTLPPTDFRNFAWKRWRADKLNLFTRDVRDAIKARGDHLIFSSSPSLYPWSYDEYLQDSKTWVDYGYVDNIIPQVYRYNYSDYVFELDKTLGFYPRAKRNIFYSGMLMKVGSYLISPEFLLNSLQANRTRNINGEAFFFYEGLRANNNLLGDTLKATYYARPALVPHRNGNIWRPRAIIVNEDDPGVVVLGDWSASTIAGFTPNILIKKDPEYGSIAYYFNVPDNAWYDIFAYNVTGPLATKRASVTIYSDNDSAIVYLDQQNSYRAGWQPLRTAYLTSGFHKVIKLDNIGVPAGQYVVADATMIMLNRKLSPDVIITPVPAQPAVPILENFTLAQNYPNPFNATTKIRYEVARKAFVTLKVYDILGREIKELANGTMVPGTYEAIFDGKELASGTYLYRLQVGNRREVRKLVLLK